MFLEELSNLIKNVLTNAAVETINLAAGKSVMICVDKVASRETTDGNKRKLAEIISDVCPEQTLTVDLGRYYYINTVIVYGGQKMENGKEQTSKCLF